MSYFLNGFAEILGSGTLLIYMFAGVLLGMVLGALPGLTGSLGIALMLPFTYVWRRGYHMDPACSFGPAEWRELTQSLCRFRRWTQGNGALT